MLLTENNRRWFMSPTKHVDISSPEYTRQFAEVVLQLRLQSSTLIFCRFVCNDSISLQNYFSCS